MPFLKEGASLNCGRCEGNAMRVFSSPWKKARDAKEGVNKRRENRRAGKEGGLSMLSNGVRLRGGEGAPRYD